MANTTYPLPASYINTRLIMFPRIAIPSGSLSMPSSLLTDSTNTQIRFARITFTAPSSSPNINNNARRQLSRPRRFCSVSSAASDATNNIYDWDSPRHNDDFGCSLKRRPTPYPKRRICGVDWTSDTESSIDDGDSDDEEGGRVRWDSNTTDFESVLVRVQTPYPEEKKKGGFRGWCRRLRSRICPKQK